MRKQEEPKTMKDLLEETKWDIRSFKFGDLVEGTVVNKGRGDLLVDIGAKSEGIIGGKELEDGLSTFRNVKVGDKVVAFVIQSEDDQGYVVLSLKRAAPESMWRKFRELQNTQKSVEVKVLDYNKGGLIVDSGAGIRGFIPLSHIDRAHFPLSETRFPVGSVSQREDTLSKLRGKSLLAQIVEVDKTSNRLILSEKNATAEATRGKREAIIKSLSLGSVVEGVVSGVMPFGIFVSIDDLEALVHISELGWDKVREPSELCKVGDKVRAEVIEIEPESNKVSLSIKRLSPDPWEKAGERYQRGSLVEGTVTRITPFGAFVRLEPGLDGLIHVSETVGPLSEGSKVRAVVVSIEPELRKLGLSIKQLVGREAKLPVKS